MKTLIQKELRENLKIAALCFLMAIAVVIGTQLYYIDLIQGIAKGISTPQNYYYRLQPMTSGNLQGFAAVCCALAGFMMGWFQVHSERNRDLWAFLVHRPVSRTQIFASKVIAGLFLYFLSIGLPFAYLVFWAATPGHIAAPFDWSMSGALVVDLIWGVGFYFAGMLTSVRQARWYGSRALGVAAAVFVMIWMRNGELGPWLALFLVLSLAVAVWGAFYNRGQFEGQPAMGKVALTLSLIPGMSLVALGCVALVIEMFAGPRQSDFQPHYKIGVDGVIYKIVQVQGVPQVLTLDGKVFHDPETGRPANVEEFERISSPAQMVSFGTNQSFSSMESGQYRFFGGDEHTIWYVNLDSGRIEGYDTATRIFTASIGPDGFVPTRAGEGSRFILGPENLFPNWSLGEIQTMASKQSVYEIDFAKRTVPLRWIAPDGDEIKGVSAGHFEHSESLVVTKKKITILDARRGDKTNALTIPFPSSLEDYSSVTDYMEYGEGRSKMYRTIWVSPLPAWTGWESSSDLPIHVIRLSPDGTILKEMDLPVLKTPPNPRIADNILGIFSAPALQLVFSWMNAPRPSGLKSVQIKAKEQWAGLAVSFCCMIIGIIIGRRYRFSAQQQTAWAVFHLLFGLPGLFVFIAVREWPARVPCEKCGKLRVVENELCEHCGSAFSAPKKNGTEIFEALETV